MEKKTNLLLPAHASGRELGSHFRRFRTWWVEFNDQANHLIGWGAITLLIRPFPWSLPGFFGDHRKGPQLLATTSQEGIICSLAVYN